MKQNEHHQLLKSSLTDVHLSQFNSLLAQNKVLRLIVCGYWSWSEENPRAVRHSKPLKSSFFLLYTY